MKLTKSSIYNRPRRSGISGVDPEVRAQKQKEEESILYYIRKCHNNFILLQ